MTGPMAKSMVSENSEELFGQVLKVVTADENGIVCTEDMKQFVIMVEM